MGVSPSVFSFSVHFLSLELYFSLFHVFILNSLMLTLLHSSYTFHDMSLLHAQNFLLPLFSLYTLLLVDPHQASWEGDIGGNFIVGIGRETVRDRWRENEMERE